MSRQGRAGADMPFCAGSSPRSALYKICANKKIGKKVKGAEDHILKYDDLPEERRRDASALEDAEKRDIPAPHT